MNDGARETKAASSQERRGLITWYYVVPGDTRFMPTTPEFTSTTNIQEETNELNKV